MWNSSQGVEKLRFGKWRKEGTARIRKRKRSFIPPVEIAYYWNKSFLITLWDPQKARSSLYFTISKNSWKYLLLSAEEMIVKILLPTPRSVQKTRGKCNEITYFAKAYALLGSLWVEQAKLTQTLAVYKNTFWPLYHGVNTSVTKFIHPLSKNNC